MSFDWLAKSSIGAAVKSKVTLFSASNLATALPICAPAYFNLMLEISVAAAEPTWVTEIDVIETASEELAVNLHAAISLSVAPESMVAAAGLACTATNNSPTEIPATVRSLPCNGKVPVNVPAEVISLADSITALMLSPTVAVPLAAILILTVKVLVSPAGIFQFTENVALWVLVFNAWQDPNWVTPS